MKGAVDILISDNINFKTKTVTRGKKEFFILKKMSIFQKSITIVNIYDSENRNPKYMMQKNERIERKSRELNKIVPDWLSTLNNGIMNRTAGQMVKKIFKDLDIKECEKICR